jgi:hypothetical protein
MAVEESRKEFSNVVDVASIRTVRETGYQIGSNGSVV